MSLSHGELLELDDLIDAVCSEELTEDQSIRLQELTATNVEARPCYLRSLRLHARMQWYFRAPVFSEIDTWSLARSNAASPVLIHRAGRAFGTVLNSHKLVLSLVLLARSSYFAGV